MRNDQILNIYCDGGSRGNPGPAASAFVVQTISGKQIFQLGRYLGIATNNQAEYDAVLSALNWLSINNPQSEVVFYLDSLLVVSQLTGKYKIKNPDLKIKNLEIKHLISNFKLKILNFVYVPRTKNFSADLLVNKTLDQQ